MGVNSVSCGCDSLEWDSRKKTILGPGSVHTRAYSKHAWVHNKMAKIKDTAENAKFDSVILNKALYLTSML